MLFCKKCGIIRAMLERVIVKMKRIFVPYQENNYRPKALDSNFLVYFLLGLLALKIVSLAFLLEFPKSAFFADVSKTVLVGLLNSERRGAGLSELQANPLLERAAMLKAQDMLSQGYFSHNSPEGVTPWHWFRVAGYNYYYGGENLGIGFLESEEIHKAWNDSPSHKANLLNPNYKEVGIAVVRGDFKGAPSTVVVQLFGSQKTQALGVPVRESKPEAPATVKPVEVAPETQIAGWPQEESAIKSTTAPVEGLRFGLYKFMATHYSNLLQGLVFYALVVVAALLLVNVFVKINVQHRDLNFKILGLLLLFVLCVYLNKDIMLKFIPHFVGVY